MKVFFVLAVLGLILSLTAHLATFVGIDPMQVCPWVWFLHMGIFVVWIPVVFLSNRCTKDQRKKDHLQVAMQNSPAWMQKLVGPLFTYVLFNFFFTIFFLQGGYTPRQVNGQFSLTDHGKLVRNITQAEYHRQQAYQVRAFSGHWILFYALASLVLYPTAKSQGEAISETLRDV